MGGIILVTCRQMQEELSQSHNQLTESGYDVVTPELVGQQFSSEELAPMMPGVVAMIAGDDQLDRRFFEASSDLRVLVRWGIGMDSVDHDAARAHGVVVRNTPGVFGGEVADSALAFVLLLARGHHLTDREVREGAWVKREGISLAGSTMAVVGMGDIGSAVARRALGFGMQVVGLDPFVDQSSAPLGVTMVGDVRALVSEARFVVLTCPLTPETHHLVDAAFCEHMRSDGYLVNVARGPVVDEPALVDALSSRQIAGAGLDVFEVEPLPLDSPLRTLPNVVLGAHNGSNTREGVARASGRAVEIALAELAAP